MVHHPEAFEHYCAGYMSVSSYHIRFSSPLKTLRTLNSLCITTATQWIATSSKYNTMARHEMLHKKLYDTRASNETPNDSQLSEAFMSTERIR
jgi:hypothetical protein